MIQTLLDLTEYGLKGKLYPHPIKDEKQFLKMAFESGLIGIIFESIDSKQVSEYFYKEIRKIFYNFVGSDNAQRAFINKLDSLFNKNNIKHTFLKGSHLKTIYQKSYFRGMGDVDCLVDKKDTKKISTLLKELDFEVHAKSEEHDVYEYKGLMVEIHRTISHTLNKKTQSLFSKPEEHLIQDEYYRYRLEYTYEGVYLLHHLSKHIMSSGVGLRSLLDISIFFNYYEAQIDRTKLQLYLTETGLEKFFMIILAFNEKAFRVKTSFLDNEFQLDKTSYETLLKYLVTSGIHGKGKEFNEMAPRTVNESKFKVLLRVLFPNWNNMKEMYSWLKYIPILLPFAYMIRWFKLVFLRSKNSFRKLSKLKNSNDEKDELKKLFEDLGL